MNSGPASLPHPWRYEILSHSLYKRLVLAHHVFDPVLLSLPPLIVPPSLRATDSLHGPLQQVWSGRPILNIGSQIALSFVFFKYAILRCIHLSTLMSSSGHDTLP